MKTMLYATMTAAMLSGAIAIAQEDKTSATTTTTVAPAAQETKAPATVEVKIPEWVSAVKFKGDVRVRHEYIEQDGKEDRHRQRLRARLAAEGKVNEDVKLGIQAISGSDDPVSSNETFDDAFSTKDLRLDLAYVAWTLAEPLTFVAGKMEQPWINVADLVWDGDVTPEGTAIKYSVGENTKLIAAAGYYWIDEISSSEDDVVLMSGQLALQAKTDLATLLIGGSLYAYDNVAGSEAFGGGFFGNTTTDVITEEDGEEVETSYYAEDYQIAEGFASLSSKPAGVPLKLYGQVAVNADDDSGEDTGYLVGLKLLDAKKPGQVDFDYNWRSIEKNAVLGLLSDSDFIGGGSNGEGSKIKLNLMIAKNWSAGATLFMNQIDPDGKDTDYTRVQLDLAAKF